MAIRNYNADASQKLGPLTSKQGQPVLPSFLLRTDISQIDGSSADEVRHSDQHTIATCAPLRPQKGIPYGDRRTERPWLTNE